MFPLSTKIIPENVLEKTKIIMSNEQGNTESNLHTLQVIYTALSTGLFYLTYIYSNVYIYTV